MEGKWWSQSINWWGWSDFALESFFGEFWYFERNYGENLVPQTTLLIYSDLNEALCREANIGVRASLIVANTETLKYIKEQMWEILKEYKLSTLGCSPKSSITHRHNVRLVSFLERLKLILKVCNCLNIFI